MCNTRGRKYSLGAPNDERKYRSKHVEQARNNKLSYTVAFVCHFRKLNCVVMLRSFGIIDFLHQICNIYKKKEKHSVHRNI
jgi:hypothetical protein